MFGGKSNIVLIGMPGSGKTTIGKRLARHYDLQFLDGDSLIEAEANMPIQSIVDRLGVRRLLKIEADVLAKLDCSSCVISTGGSAVYNHTAMTKLGERGVRVYLEISYMTMQARIGKKPLRGLAKYPAHSLQRLYRERADMYPRYADVVFENNLPFTDVRARKLFTMLDAV